MRHLDEGEIHAWLDGAVGADESVRIEAHVGACAACAAEVATARGLIAGASRILLALDSIPGGVIPARGGVAESASVAGGSASVSGGSGVAPAPSDFERFRATRQAPQRQTPWYARPVTRIAAGLVMAVGIGTLATRDRDSAADMVSIDFRTEAISTASAPEAAADSVAPAAVGVPAAAPPAQPAPGSPQPGDASSAVGDNFGAEEARRRGAGGTRAPAPPPVGVQLPPSLTSPGAAVASRSEAVAAAERVANSTSSVAGKLSGVAVASAPPSPLPGSRVGSALADSAAVARQSGSLRLETVVTTGAPTATDGQRLGFAAATVRPAAIGGACFALDVTPPAGSTGIPAVPRRLRIQLEESTVADGAQSAIAQAQTGGAGGGAAAANNLQGGASQARARDQAALRAINATAIRPAGALPWEPIAGDSVVARWMTGADVIIFRLQLVGAEVKGTAAAQASSAPPSTVTGQRTPCAGGE